MDSCGHRELGGFLFLEPAGDRERSDANLHPVACNDRLKRPVCGLERAKQAAAFDHFPVVSNETPGRNRQRDEHTSELQSLMRISYAVFCLKKKKIKNNETSII